MFVFSHGHQDKERIGLTLPGAEKTFLNSLAGEWRGWGGAVASGEREKTRRKKRKKNICLKLVEKPFKSESRLPSKMSVIRLKLQL
jgi:hypothetical protein